MWISRKEYKFLKENAEKNIDAECKILKIKDEQMKQTARAMIEYSSVLKERDELKEQVHNLCNLLHAKEKPLDCICESKNLNGIDQAHCHWYKDNITFGDKSEEECPYYKSIKSDFYKISMVQLDEYVHNIAKAGDIIISSDISTNRKLIYICGKNNIGKYVKPRWKLLDKTDFRIGDNVETLKGEGLIIAINNDDVTVSLYNGCGIYDFNINTIEYYGIS